ncbi:SPOSA6832_04047, partial [Sporobolomyces salmonicolor]
MAAQSGIGPSAGLQSAWSAALQEGTPRLFKLVPAGQWKETQPSEDEPAKGLETDFALFEAEGVVQDTVPAYYLVRLASTPTSSWLFISYVPDAAPVRSKMLYASTRATLVRSLGDSRFETSIFATSKADLTYASYLSHLTHDAASAPLTAREQEMAAIRAAEAATAEQDGGDPRAQQGRSMIFGTHEAKGGANDALPWTEEAKEAVKRLKEEGGREVVQLEIDVGKEQVVLAENQPTHLILPPSSPCYFFYRHPAGIVLIYSCPPSSPIKSRLIYSSTVLTFYKYATPEFTGVQVLKKVRFPVSLCAVLPVFSFSLGLSPGPGSLSHGDLETDTPSEVTPSWIDEELGALATPPPPPSTSSTRDAESCDAGAPPPPRTGAGAGAGGAPLPQDDAKPFARPTRPGRRR